MTTICFRSGQLAADSLISYGSYTSGEREKIAKCGEGWHVALAGNAWLRRPLEEWCRKDCPEDAVPKVLLDNEDDFNALFVNAWGAVFTFTKGYLIPVPGEYAAIGSGAVFALGAMAHGATAEEAVRAAAKHDKSTGGAVSTVQFPLS